MRFTGIPRRRASSAFAKIRDGGYLAWAAGIFVAGTVPGSILFALLDPDYGGWPDTARHAGINILAGTAFAAAVYLAGRRLGGNGSWRKVFPAISYSSVLAFPVFAVLAALMILGGSEALQVGDPTGTPDTEPTTTAGDFAGGIAVLHATQEMAALVAVGAAACVAWVAVVLVKAVKTVNGFGTAKAFGLVVLGWLAWAAISVSFNA